MSFGSMEGWMLPEEKALPVLKHAFDVGINTWDTVSKQTRPTKHHTFCIVLNSPPSKSDVYSFGESERIIGKAIITYNLPRDRLVILSKCYGGIPSADDFRGLSEIEQLRMLAINDGVMVNRIGLSRKHIFDAVKGSVERLGTHLDVLQIHRLDRDTPREEIMKALNDVVESGMVRYIGASSVSDPNSTSLKSERLTIGPLNRCTHGNSKL